MSENIFQILRSQISRNNVKLLEYIGGPEEEYWTEAYRIDNEYIECLIQKMTRTRVENV